MNKRGSNGKSFEVAILVGLEDFKLKLRGVLLLRESYFYIQKVLLHD